VCDTSGDPWCAKASLPGGLTVIALWSPQGQAPAYDLVLTTYVSDQYSARASAVTGVTVEPPPPALYGEILLNASTGLDAALATSDPATVFQIIKSVAAVASQANCSDPVNDDDCVAVDRALLLQYAINASRITVS
jgi:hypothetical protein